MPFSIESPMIVTLFRVLPVVCLALVMLGSGCCCFEFAFMFVAAPLHVSFLVVDVFRFDLLLFDGFSFCSLFFVVWDVLCVCPLGYIFWDAL